MTHLSNNVPVDFSEATRQRLINRGFILTGLRDTEFLAADSQIEGPTCLLASVPRGSFLKLGAFCNISTGSLGNVSIGRYCSFAEGTTLGAHAHPVDWLTSSRIAYYPQVRNWDKLMLGQASPSLQERKPRFNGSCPITTIGDDVWLGQGVFVKSGVTIGTGAVVGARSVVTADVPPYAIVAGTPARVIRMRFDEDLVEKMMKVAWWRYSLYDLFDVPFDQAAVALDQISELEASDKIQPYEAPNLTEMLHEDQTPEDVSA